MHRFRRALKKKHRWVVYVITLVWCWSAADSNQAYAQSWRAHEERVEELDKIASNLGLDPDQVKDPEAYRQRQEAKSREQAAAAAKAATKPAGPTSFGDLPEHVR